MLLMHHHWWDVEDRPWVVEENLSSHCPSEQQRDQHSERPLSGELLLALELLHHSGADSSLHVRSGFQLVDPVERDGPPVCPGLGGIVNARVSSRAVFERSCVICSHYIWLGAGDIRQGRWAIH